MFCGALTAMLTAVPVVVSHISALEYAFPPERRLRLDHEWYFDNGLSGHGRSHHVLYHGLGSVLEHLRKADIVFLGNSRTVFAFPDKPMDSFASRYGVRCYNLGLGYAETCMFPMEILRKHDLRPGIIVVNEDMFFAPPSAFAGQILASHGWALVRDWVEASGSYLYWRYGAITPHFLPQIPVPMEQNRAKASAMFRSERTGTWLTVNRSDGAMPVRLEGGHFEEIDSESMRIAQGFLDFLRSRNIALVLTHVPSGDPLGSHERARKMAKELQVAFIAPTPEGLATMDNSHLNRPSAEAFASAFLQELASSSVFQEMVKRQHFE